MEFERIVRKSSFVLVVVFVTVSLASAMHSVDPSSTTVEVGEASVVSFDVTNTGSGAGSEITQLTFSLPASFSFQSGSDTTTSLGEFTPVSWSGNYLLNESEMFAFGFSFVASQVGTFSLGVDSSSPSGDDATPVSVTVEDTTNPEIAIDLTNASTIKTNDLSLEVTCTDSGSVSLIELWGNWEGAYELSDSTTSVSSGNAWEISLENMGEGVYDYDVRCEDASGNEMWAGRRKVTVDLSSFDPNTDYSGLTVILSKDLAKGYKTTLQLATELKFLLGNEYYSVRLVQVDPNESKIDFLPSGQRVFFTNGDEKKFELTGDNFYDLLVTMHTIDAENKTKFVELTLKSLNETVPPGVVLNTSGAENVSVNETTLAEESSEDNLAGETGESEPNPLLEEENSLWLYIVIGVVGFIVAFVVIMLYQMKHGEKKYPKTVEEEQQMKQTESDTASDDSLDAQYNPGT